MNNKTRKIYEKVISGKSDGNIRFSDFYNLILNLGFEFDRQHGTSHMVFYHPIIKEHLNIQRKKDKAKSYQVQQLRELIKEYNL